MERTGPHAALTSDAGFPVDPDNPIIIAFVAGSGGTHLSTAGIYALLTLNRHIVHGQIRKLSGRSHIIRVASGGSKTHIILKFARNLAAVTGNAPIHLHYHAVLFAHFASFLS